MFVDDAVLGRLPAICVKDGVPTSHMVAFRHEVRSRTGLGMAWLLVLAGPLGWLGLLVIAALRRPGEVLSVRLPISEAAFARLQRARLVCLVTVDVTFVLLLAVLVSLVTGGPGDRLITVVVAVVAAACLVQLVVSDRRLRSCRVAVELDASRRWVTLDRVHPSFADAAEAASYHTCR